MKIVFFGTPEYVVCVVQSLYKHFRSRDENPISAVVTQNPKPAGRKKYLSYSPVDQWSHQKGVSTFYSLQEFMNANINADIGILASYGKIIPQYVIDAFPKGIINIHPSLLPDFRGSAPVQAAILTKKNPTGVTFIKLDEKLDHGPIISFFKEDIGDNDTSDSLRLKLFERSSDVLPGLIVNYVAGKIIPKTQDHEKAVFTRELRKEDGFISPDILKKAIAGTTVRRKIKFEFIKNYSALPTSELLERLIRAMYPWPLAWTFVKLDKDHEPKRLKLLKSMILKNAQDESKNNVYRLSLLTVQLEGKNPVSWDQFTQGYPNYNFNI